MRPKVTWTRRKERELESVCRRERERESITGRERKRERGRQRGKDGGMAIERKNIKNDHTKEKMTKESSSL